MTNATDELTVIKLLAADHSAGFVSTALRMSEADVTAIGERYGAPDKQRLRWAVDELTRQADAASLAVIPRAEHSDVAARAARARNLEAVPAVAAKPHVIASAPAQKQVPAMPEPTEPTTADRLTQLLEEAGRSSHKRTQSLGARIAELVNDLAGRLDTEAKAREEEERHAEERQKVLDELAAAEKALAEAREKARALAGGKAPSVKAAARPVGDHAPKTVRAWARANGVDCPAMGRVPGHVVEAWRKAQEQAA